MDENIKQKLLKLLAYQKKDIELRKLNDVINRDEALVVMNRNKRAFNDAKTAIAECEQLAASLLEMFAELTGYINDNEAALAELEATESVSDDELESRVRRLESLKSKFQSAEKKLRDIEERSRKVCARRTEAIKSGNAAKQKYGEARDKHAKLVASKKADVDRLNAELDALRAQLDADLYAEYVKLVDESKFPPVVPAAGDEKKNMFNCGGCGLGLPQKGNATLADSGWCRCDNCRRIIVKLDK